MQRYLILGVGLISFSLSAMDGTDETPSGKRFLVRTPNTAQQAIEENKDWLEKVDHACCSNWLCGLPNFITLSAVLTAGNVIAEGGAGLGAVAAAGPTVVAGVVNFCSDCRRKKDSAQKEN